MGELQPDAAEIERHIAVFEQGRPAYPPKEASSYRSASPLHFRGTAKRSMLVERRKRATCLGGESASATSRRGCARAVGGYFERDLVHPACSRACSPRAAVRVRRDVHRVYRFEELVICVSATRPRPRTREWCASPYSCSTRRTRARRVGGLTDKPSAYCWLGLL